MAQTSNLMTSKEFREIVLSVIRSCDKINDLRDIASDFYTFDMPSDFMEYTEEEDDTEAIDNITGELELIFSGVVELSTVEDTELRFIGVSTLITWAYMNDCRNEGRKEKEIF